MGKNKAEAVENGKCKVCWKGKRKDGVSVQGTSDKYFDLVQAEYLVAEMTALTGVKHWAERGCEQ